MKKLSLPFGRDSADSLAHIVEMILPEYSRPVFIAVIEVDTAFDTVYSAGE